MIRTFLPFLILLSLTARGQSTYESMLMRDLTDAPWQPGLAYQSNSETQRLGESDALKPMPVRSQFEVTPTTFVVSETGYLNIALSNRTVISCAPGTELSILLFRQKPIAKTINLDREYEPSRSEVELRLTRGIIVVERARPNPRSTLSIATPLGMIEADGESFLIECNENDCLVYNLNGQLRVQTLDQPERLLMTSGSVISMQDARLKGYEAMKNQPISTKPEFVRLIALASKTRASTFFDVKGDGTVYAKTMIPLRFLNQSPANKHRFSLWNGQ